MSSASADPGSTTADTVRTSVKARIGTLLQSLLIPLAIVGAVAIAFLVYQWIDDDDRITYVAASADANGELTGVFVFPDDGEQPFLDEINAAQHSIRLHIYLLSDEETIEALIAAMNRGVTVRVMLEQHPYGGAGTEQEVFERLQTAGIDVRWSDPDYRFSHIKTMVLDDRVALIMNLNLTESAFDHNREFAVVTTDQPNVRQAIEIFESDWVRAPDPSPGPLVVSPLTSRLDLMDLIQSANVSIDMYAEVITDEEIMAALAAAELRGVKVRMVMSEASGEDLWEEEPGFLARHGVDVHIQNSRYIHAKVLIIDDTFAWIGSQNFTATSLDDNRELGIVLTDTHSIVRIAKAFETDYATGDELDEAA